MKNNKKAYQKVRNQMAVMAHFMTGGGSHKTTKEKAKSRKGRIYEKTRQEIKSYY